MTFCRIWCGFFLFGDKYFGDGDTNGRDIVYIADGRRLTCVHRGHGSVDIVYRAYTVVADVVGLSAKTVVQMVIRSDDSAVTDHCGCPTLNSDIYKLLNITQNEYYRTRTTARI